MGPLLFLVMLVPFTVNGLAVRESFFVSFLGERRRRRRQRVRGRLPLLLVTVAVAVPGALILAWEGLRGASAAAAARSRWLTLTSRSCRDLQRGAVDRALAREPPGDGAEMIVVDNGSTDGTLELVREQFPEARVLEQENRGFGAGNNTGMRAASRAVLPAPEP